MSDPGPPVPLPSGVDTNPLGTAIGTQARTIAPDAFGGFYHHGDVYYVGFTRDVDANLARMRAAFPNAELHAYAARRTSDELNAVSSELEATMLETPILYAIPDEVAGVVVVGVQDPNSPAAKGIVAKYGNVVKVVQDEPLQLLGGAWKPAGR